MTRHVYHSRKQAERTAGRGAAHVSSLELPLLQGMFMSEIHLGRGEGLPPHGHPDTDELCYIIQGDISYSLVDPESHRSLVFQAVPGQVVHAPTGWCHWITSLSHGTILLLIYRTGHPLQIDLATLWPYSLYEEDAGVGDDPNKQLYSKTLLTPVPLQNRIESETPEKPLPGPPWLKTGHLNNKTTRSR